MPFWTYMLRCADASFYVGHTDDLEQRVASHVMGEVAGYTATRLPVSLVWSQEFGARYEALAAERQLKGWSRAKKEALIDGDWETIHLLSRGRRVGGRALRQAQGERSGSEAGTLDAPLR